MAADSHCAGKILITLIAGACGLVGLAYPDWRSEVSAEGYYPRSVQLSADRPGLFLEQPGELLVALPIFNSGTAPASDVEVEKISLTSATLISPGILPVVLTDIAPNERAVLDASFTADRLVPGRRYLLRIEGTFFLDERMFDFTFREFITLPPPASGEEESSAASAEPNFVSGAPFPPDPILGPPEAEVNPLGPPVPTAPPRGTVAPTSPPADVLEPEHMLDDDTDGDARAPRARGIATGHIRSQQATDRVLFVRNTPFGITQGVPPDPSGASAGDVVLASGNTYLSISTDGGLSFPILLDPTTIFPNRDAAGNLIDGGLCCDQVIHYISDLDLFVWLMQFHRATRRGDTPRNPTGPNRLRLAVASPQDIIDSNGTAWTYWDLTSATFNLGNNDLDYPDIAIGDNFLYISVDVVGGAGGLMVARIPFIDLQFRRPLNGLRYTNPNTSTSAFFMHIMQKPDDEIFWAGHLSDSKMQIFSWREDSTRVRRRAVNLLNTWPNRDFASIVPDGTTNWLQVGPSNGNILGLTRRAGALGDELLFGWTAGRGGGFPHPHVQLATIDRSTLRVLDQFQIWNNNFAYAFPAFTTNSDDDVGLSLAVGGPILFPTHVVGLVEDRGFELFFSTTSNAAFNRNGDYYTVRQHSPNDRLFSAEGYGVRLVNPATSTSCNVAPGCRFDPRYVLFGRASALLADLVPVPIPDAPTFAFCRLSRDLRLTVIVSNEGGSEAAPTTTTVDFSPGGSISSATPAVAVGSSVDLQFSIPRSCFNPDCGFRINIDSENRVSESDEENNLVADQCVG